MRKHKTALTAKQEQVVVRLRGRKHWSEVIGSNAAGTITVMVFPGRELFNVNRFGTITASILRKAR